MIEPDSVRTTRAGYDAVAGLYAEMFSSDLERRPLERVLLTAFADFVRAGADGGKAGAGRPVADLGCGPGHVTAYLRSLGLDAFGIDLSPKMVALAREAWPEVRYETGSMAALDLPAGSLDGIVARYSIIHTPPEQLPAILAEFARALAPGGHLLLAFQADTDPAAPLAGPFPHRVAPAYRWSPDRIAALLHPLGFTEAARLVRAPDEDERAFPQAQLLMRRTAEAEGAEESPETAKAAKAAAG
jgi:SAM-dependent methyltransferase